MKWITGITITLFVILAALALVLSYTGLQTTAANNGKPGPISYFWPVLIDGGLIIFSLAIVYRLLRNDKPYVQWLLVILFTTATVAFNVFQSSYWLTEILVKASAPIVLVLTFETLMSIIRSRVKRDQLLDNLKQLKKQIAQLQTERQQFETEMSAERDKLKTQIERLKNKTVKLAEQEQELSDTQKQIVNLIREGVINKSEIARQLDVNRGTVYTELAILETLGIISNNGNGLQVTR